MFAADEMMSGVGRLIFGLSIFMDFEGDSVESR